MWDYLLSKKQVHVYEKHDRSIIFETELLSFTAGTDLALSHARCDRLLQNLNAG